jgi:hypothetical protein
MEVHVVLLHMTLKALGKIPDPTPAKYGIRNWPSALRAFGPVKGMVLIETLYRNIITLRTNLNLQEWVAKEAENRYKKVLDELNALKAE